MNKKSRTEKFMYNTVATAIYQIIIMLAGFITPKIMLDAYGSEINGLVTSITQFISYFNLVEAGLAGAAVFSLYKPLAENDYKSINKIIVAAKKFYIKSGYLFTALVGLLAIIYPFTIKTNLLSIKLVIILVIVLGVKGSLEFFTMAKYRVILTADQKTYVVSIASAIYTILNTIIISIFASLKFNVVIVYIFAILPLFARMIILKLYVKKNYNYLDYNEEPDNQALNKRWDALFLQLLNTVQTGVPVILTTIFTNLKVVSVYSIYNMILTGINGVLSIFINGLSASFGDIIVRGEIDTLQKTYKDFEYIYYNIITGVYAIALIMIMPFIKIYTKGITDINYNLPIIGFLFVINGFLYNIKTPQGMLVISAGLYKETRIQSTIQALIIIVVGSILAPSIGLVGIMIASCISNVYRDIDLLFFIPKNVTKLKVKDSIYRIIKMIITFNIIVIPFIFIKIEVNSFISWIIYAVIVSVYTLAIILITSLIWDRQYLISNTDRIKRLIMRV